MSKSISADKPQPLPWTHQETIHLIQAYQEKWYSFGRGQLRSSQWEKVAAVVAARCGYSDYDPSKTSIQCRSKMEKLRQRYRAEKQRISFGGASDWTYFHLMDNVLCDPPPISARPMSSIPYDSKGEDQQPAEKSDDYHSDEDDVKNFGKSRSMSCILQRPVVDDGAEGKGEMEKDDRRMLYSQLAAEIRLFAERLAGMENTKLEMMKETERRRMAMENRRMEMILESEQKIVNSIARAFGSSKRLKISQEI